jgi:membrane associated rhomboid family serine protease
LFDADMMSGVITPLFSFMFLHGGWLHIVGNMLYLWIFGDNVEDRMGHPGYLIFYIICGMASGLVQILIAPASRLPIVGASGAIAGVMGAYLLLYPFARVVTLFFFFIFIEVVHIPAFFFLGFWFILQFFSGSFSLAGQEGGVAWWAHIGGFLCGLIMVVPFTRKKKPLKWVLRKRQPW